MDECLVHSSDFSDTSDDDYRQAEACRDGAKVIDVSVDEPGTFRLNIDGGVTCLVHKRPGLEAFLAACAAEFETYVFTAGTRAYAEPLLDQLDPEKQLLVGRFYRTDCRPVCLASGEFQYLKDLTAVNSADAELNRIVLVDNNPISFVCQPRNGIPVTYFIGQKEDVVLHEVLQLLRELAQLPDVRPRLDELFCLDLRLAAARKHFLGIRYDPARHCESRL